MLRTRRLVALVVSASIVVVVGVVIYLGITLISNNQELEATLDTTSAVLEATTQELAGRSQELGSTTEELHATTQNLHDTASTLESVEGDLASTETQLEATAKELAHTGQVLDSTAQELDTTKEELDTTTHELSTATVELASTTDQLHVTTQELDTTTEELGTTAKELASTLDTLASTTEELESTEEELGATSGRLASTSTQLATTKQELSVALRARDDRDEQLRAIRARVGTLEALETKLVGLESLIEQRTPLIPETSVGTFACTGSMEPAITCLDSALWLDNYDPYDIVVGSVISFMPQEGCRPTAEHVSHRVIEAVKEENYVAFRTKGDNAYDDVDDGCWITPEYVQGYMTALYKGTHPENASLREDVNAARAETDRTEVAYVQAVSTYEDHIDRYCPNYSCPQRYYPRATSLFDATEDSKEGYLEASDVYECWLETAINLVQPIPVITLPCDWEFEAVEVLPRARE